MNIQEILHHKKPHLSPVRKFAVGGLVVVLFVCTFALGFQIGTSSNQSKESSVTQEKETKEGKLLKTPKEKPSFLHKDVDFNLLWEVWNRAKKDAFVKDTPDTKLFYGALSGIISALDDPYSVFFDPDTAKKFKESLSGTFDGIGAEIGIKDNQLIVVTPLDNSPAKAAGIRAGDRILAIDKRPTNGMAVDYAVSIIRGKKGTPVTLTIYHDGAKKEEDISIIRAKIEIASVTWKVPDEKGIATIKVSHFNLDTEKKFSQAVKEILAKKPKGLILDLRNNPGGYLDAAVSMSGYWIDGNVVVSQQFSDSHKEDLRSFGKARLSNVQTVVLINEGSASASEIVAGALQDYKKAHLVGKKTFGKGSVQDLSTLKDGSAIKLTIAKWFTPLGRSIDKEGITPDTAIEMKFEDYEAKKDPQLDKAREILLGK